MKKFLPCQIVRVSREPFGHLTIMKLARLERLHFSQSSLQRASNAQTYQKSSTIIHECDVESSVLLKIHAHACSSHRNMQSAHTSSCPFVFHKYQCTIPLCTLICPIHAELTAGVLPFCHKENVMSRIFEKLMLYV